MSNADLQESDRDGQRGVLANLPVFRDRLSDDEGGEGGSTLVASATTSPRTSSKIKVREARD
jgi:hypothetical protein